MNLSRVFSSPSVRGHNVRPCLKSFYLKTTMPYGLMLVTLFASFCFPSTALPFGGPNIWLGGMSVLLMLLNVYTTTPVRLAPLAERPIVLPFIVSLLASIWICMQSIYIDALSWRIVGWAFLGTGILVSSYYSYTTLQQIRGMLMTIVGTVFLSGLFGFLVLHADAFFWTLWLNIAEPAEKFSEDVQQGRLSGLAPRVVNFAYHLAVAVPISVAALLYNPFSSRILQRVYNSLGYVIAVILIVSIFVNGTRSLLLGATWGVILVLASPTLMTTAERVRFIQRAVIVAGMLTIGVFVTISAYNKAIQRDTRLYFEPALSPLPNCLTSLGEIVGEKSVSGAWTGDCLSSQRPDSLTYYYQFILKSPSLMTIDLTSSRSNPYLYLYSKERAYELLTENDNGAYLRNARIADGRLDPGTYVVEVTTYLPESSGNFTLTLTTFCSNPETIVLSSEGRDVLTSAWGKSCPISRRREGSFARYFRFHIDSEDEVQIQIEAEGLVPSLFLFSETKPDRIIPLPDPLKTLIGDRWHSVRYTCSHLPRGDYEIEVVSNVPRIEGNFVIIMNWNPSSGQAPQIDPIETLTPFQSQAKPPDQREIHVPDLYRVVDFSNSPWFRLHMMVTAFRYALEFPLGTGNKYAPQLRHIDESWGRENFIKVLASIPHNQFFYCLVLYGFPGLAFLISLYALMFWSMIRSALLFRRLQTQEGLFVVTAVSAATTSYLINSLFHDHGPFTKDWAHLILVGALLAMERIQSLPGRTMKVRERGSR